MKSTLLNIVLLSALAFANADETQSSHILKLTSSNFTEEIEKNQAVIIKFATTWCSNSQEFAPVYEKVATSLEDKIKFAEVDCEAESKLCEALGVSGYPVVFYVSAEGDSSIFTRDRTVEELTKWATRTIGEPYTTVSTEDEFKDVLSKQETDVYVVMKVPSLEKYTNDISTFKTVATRLREKITFILLVDPLVTISTLTLYKNYDDPSAEYQGGFYPEEIVEFIQSESIELFGEISPDNFETYLHLNKPIIWTFIDDDKEKQKEFIENITKVARIHRNDVIFVRVNPARHGEFADAFGLTKPEGMVLENRDSGHIFINPDNSFQVDTVTDFIKKYLDGKINRTIRSQQPPTDENNTDPIKILVGSTFNKNVIQDTSRDSIVLVFAPWSEPSQDAVNVFQQVSLALEHDKNIFFGIMDGSTNDIPDDRVPLVQFPAILFYPADQKEKNPQFYQAKMEKQEIEKFIAEMRSTKTSQEQEDRDEL